jgi:inward rectifier potassium channel
MYPETRAANMLVTVEMLLGLSMVALTTGLLFAKFSVPRARMQFAEVVAVAPFNGQPMLMFRLGNERASQIVEAVVRVVMLRTERTDEGVLYYRMYDLVLERDRTPALSRSWTVMHRMERGSPLDGATPESLEREEVELLLTVTGVDESSSQSLHARHRYEYHQVRWGVRHADMLSELPDGRLRLDMRRFHELVPAVGKKSDTQTAAP